MIYEVLVMLCSIFFLLLAGYFNARDRKGWSYTLFILGMIVFVSILEAITSESLTSNAQDILAFSAFFISVFIFGFSTFFYEKSRKVTDSY